MQIVKFFLGILLVQTVTVVLILLSPSTWDMADFLRLIIPLFFISLMVAFWFSSLASHFRKDSEEKIKKGFEKERAKLKGDFASEKEKIKVNAERAKTRVVKEAQKNIAQEAKITHAKANFKVGAAFAGVIAVGGLFVFAQMLTVGLLTLTTAGGALGGYYYRGRRIENKKMQELEVIDTKVIEHKDKK